MTADGEKKGERSLPDAPPRQRAGGIARYDNDGSVPVANALLMVEALQKAGARHTFHRYPDLGHMQITQEVIDKSLAFIKEVSAKPAK